MSIGESHEPYAEASLSKAKRYLDALSGKTWKDASPICDLEETDASDSVAGATPTFKRGDDA